MDDFPTSLPVTFRNLDFAFAELMGDTRRLPETPGKFKLFALRLGPLPVVNLSSTKPFFLSPTSKRRQTSPNPAKL